MTTRLQSFDPKGWISRFGEALEDTAATARLGWVPFRMYGSRKRDLCRKEQYRRYRGMAELARTDPYAAKLFDESQLWLDSLPDGVLDLLLEHPVIEHAWSGGSREGFDFVQVLGGGHADVKSLIAILARLSVKVGGERAATMLHRFLVAGEGLRLHAHEITVLHGLKLEDPVPLGQGAYLASYDAVRKRFGLPEDPGVGRLLRPQGAVEPGQRPGVGRAGVVGDQLAGVGADGGRCAVSSGVPPVS